MFGVFWSICGTEKIEQGKNEIGKNDECILMSKEDNRKNRKALVTGATGWIGPGIVMELAQAGIDVVLHYRSNPDIAEKLARDVGKIGRQAFCVQGDLTLEQDRKGIVKRVSDEFGGVDILVNNAGYYVKESLMQITDQQWNRQIETDLFGSFNLIRALAGNMIEGKWGRIINMSSISGFNYIRGEGAYGVAKAAVNMLTRAFGAELAPYGVTVNAVAPGPTEKYDTPYPPDPRHHPESVLIPDRRPGHAREVAALIRFLVSDEAAHINGQILPIDGGLSSVLTLQMPDDNESNGMNYSTKKVKT